MVQAASPVCHRGKTLVVKRVDHKSFLTLPKVCQGDSIKPCQKVFVKTKHFARYVLSSMLDGDSSFWHTGCGCLLGHSHPLYLYYTRQLLSFYSSTVNGNSSAKVVSPFKPSRIAGLRFQQSSFWQAEEYSWNDSCLVALLSPWKAEKFPITGWKAWKKGKIKIQKSRLWQKKISTTDW